jgi:hypothetical protein
VDLDICCGEALEKVSTLAHMSRNIWAQEDMRYTVTGEVPCMKVLGE